MSTAQRSASDPTVSAFVSAHAGTGKTKLLIDRLLRLMLADADPARILCLTYTKAAAAEMAIRLQQRLGDWVTMPDRALDAALSDLDVQASPSHRQTARALFARVLDLPGGMRIGTIHAFCQSLLKRFPLEAQISPHFRLVEPSDARATLEQAREAALPSADPASLEVLAGLVNADGFASLLAALEARRDRLTTALTLPPDALEAAFRRVLGVTARSETELLAAAVAWPDEMPLRQAAERAARHGSAGAKAKATELLEWLNLRPDDRIAHWSAWIGHFLKDDGTPRGLSGMANKALLRDHPDLPATFEAEQARVDAVQDQRRAFALARASAALLRVAAPILHAYETAKQRRGLLGYEDLIARTRLLLEDPDRAAWVLYKLDGGLDHLLLDEVQDTAPEQWTIADRLTGDFFAGDSARTEGALSRTMFAVGDKKQSIYSFQGADPDEFERWHGIYRRRVTQAGLPWRSAVLDVSYRSTPPVLSLVDAVFTASGRSGGVYDGPDTVHHVPHRTGQAGHVELWPPAPRPQPQAHVPWSVPAHNEAQISAPQTLVNHLARWIADAVRGGVTLQSTGATLHPRDILVLVRRRGDFDRALVRALKALNVPVAGLDRMVLTEQPAVQDLLALCDSLLLPQDDLSFAEMLVSPLGGLSDDSLMQLAVGRATTLWETLGRRAAERPDWQAAQSFFQALLSRVDYSQPYALLSEALGPLGGRVRLFARLGPDAAEPVDELLAAALLHASSHTPSLQGFLHWLRLSAAEVKREAESAGDTVRIMTVHGAKGLEAPLVILPDTTGLPPDDRGLDWAEDEATGATLPLWMPGRTLRCAAIERRKRDREAGRRREYHRLLYVALTRARDRVLVCGWALHRQHDGNWHEMVTGGMRALQAEAREFSAWPGQALILQSRQVAPPQAGLQAPTPHADPVPAWAGQAPDWRPAPLPPEPALPRPLAPSRPDGVELGSVPPARSPLAGGTAANFNRGTTIHTLLQHLPAIDEAERDGAALAYARQAQAGGRGNAAALAGEALAVMRSPALAALFGPGSRAEQPIAGVVAGRVVSGQVDRLAVTPHQVLIADYKTSRSPPASPDAAPVLYLRQMAAYRAVLALLYPRHDIVCTLVWTDGPAIMTLPAALLDLHAPGAARADPAGADPAGAPSAQ